MRYLPLTAFATASLFLLTGCGEDRIATPKVSVSVQGDNTASSLIGPAENYKFGFNAIGLRGFPDETRRQLLYYARESGFHYVRIPVPWADVHPSSWDASDADVLARMDQMVQAVADMGLEAVFSVDKTPCWAQEYQDCNIDQPPHHGFHWYWQQFIIEMNNRYPGVRYWSLINEPNFSFRSPHYATAACPAGDWMVAYDESFRWAADVLQPAGKVIVAPELAGGGVPASLGAGCAESEARSLERFVTTDGWRMQAQDVYSVHSYSDEGQLPRIMATYDSILTAYFIPNPIWLTEWTFNIGWEDNDERVAAYHNTAAFQKFQDGTFRPSRVTKIFKWSLWNGVNGMGAGVINVRVDPYNPSTYLLEPRPVYWCLREVARQLSLDPICTIFP
jgi:hypothetical protein